MLKSLLLSLAGTTLAIPASNHFSLRQTSSDQQNTTLQDATAWDAGAVTSFPIHSSCNATQRAQIAAGLNETILLAEHAKEHVLRWGNTSELYQKYFGELAPFEVIGSLDIIVRGDKGAVLFRCDNPDGNCGQEGALHSPSLDDFSSLYQIAIDRNKQAGPATGAAQTQRARL
jgi:hypothetical protein